jgi:2-methylisocitrate lyase-like PEP mutase family enzyme
VVVARGDHTQLAAIRSELADLRELIVSVGSASNRAQIDQLNALVENLQTAGLRMKAAMDHMQSAQRAQTVANEHLMAAAQEQSEALASFMLPNYPPDVSGQSKRVKHGKA